MVTTNDSITAFSLSEGGPFNKALLKMRLSNSQRKLAIVGLCITWVPLVIITAIEGTLYSGVQLPFLADVAFQARMLVALPMLILIKEAIDSKVIAVVAYISNTLMSADERQLILSTALQRAKRWTNSGLTEIILLLIVIGATISLVNGNVFTGLKSGTESWMASGSEDGNMNMSFGGYWAIFISIPLFQFLILRWLWRYIVWILLLFRLSKARLNLLPFHPDRAGGLGIIILAQRNFNLLFMAGSVVLSGQFIALLTKNPDSFMTIRTEAIGYIIICIIVIIFPLLFFIRKLVNTKQQGLLRLSKVGEDLGRRFEAEWIDELPIEKRVDAKEVNPSVVFDYSGIYESVQQLRTIPITLRDIIGMALMLVVPFVPILFIHFSVGELLQRIAGLLA